MDVVAIIVTAAISTAVGIIVTAIFDSRRTKRQTNNAKSHATENGLQSLLRAEIIRQHEKYTERGYAPIYAKDALQKEYEAYHALGGNGVITDLYNDIMRLPETAPEQHKNSSDKED